MHVHWSGMSRCLSGSKAVTGGPSSQACTSPRVPHTRSGTRCLVTPSQLMVFKNCNNHPSTDRLEAAATWYGVVRGWWSRQNIPAMPLGRETSSAPARPWGGMPERWGASWGGQNQNPLWPGWESITYPLRKAWIALSAKGHSLRSLPEDLGPSPPTWGPWFHAGGARSELWKSLQYTYIALLPAMLLDFCSFVKDYLRSDFWVPLSGESCRFWTSGPKCQTGYGVPTAIQPDLFLRLPQIKMSPPPTNLQNTSSISLWKVSEKTLWAAMKVPQTSPANIVCLKVRYIQTYFYLNNVLCD